MKIAFIWWTMGPYHYARMNAIARLIDIDLTVYEIAPFDDHNWEIQEKGTPLFNHIVVTNRNLNGITKFIGSLKFYLYSNLSDYDAVIDGLGYSNPISFLFKSRKSKFILWSESTLRDNKRSVIKGWLITKILTMYTAAIVAGKRHRKMLASFRFSNDNIFEVGNVIDNKYFNLAKTSNQSTVRILFVGRLLAIKNVDFLIKSFSKVQEKIGDKVSLKLIIVGSGEQQISLENQAKEIPNVHFLGSLQPSQLREEYMKSSIFVLPSISEPWGLVINEAMASGLPILASKNCGCVPELVKEGENGFSFDPKNEEQFCTKLMQLCLMSNEERVSMGEKSREIVQYFSPEQYAHRVRDSIVKILSK